jgi:ubiquitin-conjugating enzyme E2 H
MVSANKRKEKDVMKLLVSDYEVIMASELNNNEFFVKFNGPKESPYEGVGTCTQI